MGKKACCAKEGLNKGPWKPEEDKILSEYVKTNGEGCWTHIPRQTGLKRCGKSCRLRWKNYLKPDIKRGNISPDEEDLIIRLHNLLGNRWSLIAGRLPGRTDNEIKNHWNSTLRKRLQQNPKSPILNQNQPKILKQSIVSPSTNNKDPTSSICHHNTNTNTNNVIRTKAIKCKKTLVVRDPIPLDELQKTTGPNPKTEEQNHETTLTATEEGSLLRFGDLDIDFEGIHCEFNFSEFMDLDVLESANAKSLVSSEGLFGDWCSNYVSVQTKLDLNRPSTSSLDHDQDWLRD